MNCGHGHVVPRTDGLKARCGGPALCAECARDEAFYRAGIEATANYLQGYAIKARDAGDTETERHWLTIARRVRELGTKD